MPEAEAGTTPAARLPLAALIAGAVLVAAAVAAVQGSVAQAVLRGVLVLVVVPCAVIDVQRRIIPNRITGPAALVAVVLGVALDPGGEIGRVAWAAGAGAFLLVAALVNPAGMGMGDVKLLAVMGLLLGAPVVIALLVALVGSVVTGIALARRLGVRAARKTGLPFGLYLAVGAVVAAVVGDRLLHAYVSLH